MKALSLHIGVNNIDQEKYAGTSYPPLCGALNDAVAMRDVAVENGFQVINLLTESDATFNAVKLAIDHAIGELEHGGTFLLTYSGHGARLYAGSDPNEEDRYDEGFVLHDLIMKDNYIHVFLRGLPREARVIMVVDCCHSRTIHGINDPWRRSLPTTEPADVGRCERNRRIDCALLTGHANGQKEEYRKQEHYFRERAARRSNTIIVADGIVLSACGDNDRALDGPVNGLFTSCLLETLRHGGENGSPFTGTYKDFIDAIALQIGDRQTPYLTKLGPNAGNLGYPFFQEPPFTLQ